MPHGRRYTSFMLKAIVFVYITSRVVCSASEEMGLVRRVRRRLSSDVFFYESRPHGSCDSKNRTYLVDERQCVNNTELIDGCNLAISIAVDSVVSPIPGRIFVRISDGGDSERKRVLLTFNFEEDINSEANAVITFKDPQQQNISLLSNPCLVTSLEVYRGKLQNIRICHNGFNISNQRNIEIYTSDLAYDIEELKGELYRMNLSCSDAVSGCLFFKIMGDADLTNANKFGGCVPGNIRGQRTDIDDTVIKNNATARSTLPLALSTDAPGSSDAVLDYVTYAILAVAGLLILLFITALVGTILFFCRAKDKKRYR